MLHHNASLTRLDLGFNSIGKDGVGARAIVLHRNLTLTKLELTRSEWGEDGHKATEKAKAYSQQQACPIQIIEH